MIRKVILLCLVSLTCHQAKSQILISLLLGDKLNSDKLEFGLDGGINFATQTGLDQRKFSRNFNLGFYFDITLKQSWLLHTGVIVKSNLGAEDLETYTLSNPDLDNVFASGSVQRKLSYFNVPILLKRTFKNHFYLEAGPQVGLLYKAYDEFTSEVNGDEATYRNEIRRYFHPLDAGVTAGVGYRLMHGQGMNIGVRYYMGLVDVVINDDSKDVTNQSLYLTVGIPIGAEKKPNK